jgi:hypothetical protein
MQCFLMNCVRLNQKAMPIYIVMQQLSYKVNLGFFRANSVTILS